MANDTELTISVPEAGARYFRIEPQRRLRRGAEGRNSGD